MYQIFRHQVNYLNDRIEGILEELDDEDLQEVNFEWSIFNNLLKSLNSFKFIIFEKYFFSDLIFNFLHLSYYKYDSKSDYLIHIFISL